MIKFQGHSDDSIRPSGESKSAPATAVVIEPPRGWLRVPWRELWDYRDLFLTLAMRHIQLRYRQTVLGGAWAILQPAVAALVFTLVFKDMVGSTHGVPYLVFAYSGTLAWLLLATSVGEAATSMVANTQLITKVYFPRLLVPVSVFGFTLLDFAFGFVILAVLMLWFGLAPSALVLLLPLVVSGIVLCALGVSVFLSALTVKYRDFKFVVPFLLQIWFFMSPIVYPMTALPPWVQRVLVFNPMTGWLGAFRHCLYGAPVSPREVVIAASLTIALVVGSLAYFRQVEVGFADII